MKLQLISALLMSFSGFIMPVAYALPHAEDAELVAVGGKRESGRALVCMCHDMWFLLSAVSDKKQADAAAPLFRALIDRTVVLTEQLYKEGGKDVEILNEVHEDLEDSLTELTEEFDSLCKIRCFGSDKLIVEFRYAMDVGMFTDDYETLLDEPQPHLSESETKAELKRFNRLVEPDTALLVALQQVKDARSAGEIAVKLQDLAERLKGVMPEASMQNRDFAPTAGKRVRKAYAPIEPLLWGIRTEIVRIASLPGYHKTDFDHFSDALENVFRSLADTHYHFFDEVFDDSFHSDLDEALRENATTSN